MKVTLIRPPTLLPITSVAAHQGVPPLALAYLGSFLRKNHHEVVYIDAFGEKINVFSKTDYDNVLVNGLSIDEIIFRIPRDTDLIGISCMFSNEWFFIENLIKYIKRTFPHIKIVIGGEHATADFSHILKTVREVDFVILGEGEVKLLNLIHSLEKQVPLKDFSGVAFLDPKTNEVVHHNNVPRLKDINQITWPDWNGIPLELYLEKGLGMAAQNKRSYPTLASRGCPYKCTFCSSPNMWGTLWTARDIDDLINELKFAIRTYQINHIEFYDLTAIININWIKSFCQRMIDEKLDVTWSLPSGTRSEVLTLEVLKLLKKSGCTKLTYAPESGSEKMLVAIKKKINLDKMGRSIKNAVDVGIIVKINIIFGFPDQDFSDVFHTFIFLFKLALYGVHDVTCFSFSPYPGSELFERLVKENKIVRDENYNQFLSTNVYNSPFDMLSWSDRLPNFLIPIFTLGGMAFFYLFQFLFRPSRLFKLMKNFFRNRPETMMDLALHGLKNDFFYRRKLDLES